MELRDNENVDHVMHLMKLLAAKKDSAEYEPGKYKDYDWYSQDFMGDWPGTETKIKIKDFVHMFGDDLTKVIEGKKL